MKRTTNLKMADSMKEGETMVVAEEREEHVKQY